MSFIRDSYYKLTFHVKGSGPLDLVPILCFDSNNELIKNPKIHVLNQVYPKRAKTLEELVTEV